MADLTNLEDYEIFSYGHWKSFYKKLLSEITGADAEAVEKAFISEYKKIEIRKTDRSKGRDKALCDAVRSAVNWHEKSGIMLDGGRGGVYEMFRSFDLKIAKNLRGDSSLFTAALFMAAGKYFADERYCKTADTLASLMLKERTLQIKDGENKGVFKWFSGSSGLGTHSVYVSDSSRVGNSVFALYKLTGDDFYKTTVLDFGEALLKWFGGEALLPGCAFNYDKNDLITLQKNKRPACPEFYDAPMIFLGNLYSVTKDERYKEVEQKAMDIAVGKVADILSKDENNLPQGISKETLKDEIRAHNLDQLVVEISVVDAPKPIEIPNGGGAGIEIGNIFGDMLPKKTKKRL